MNVFANRKTLLVAKQNASQSSPGFHLIWTYSHPINSPTVWLYCLIWVQVACSSYQKTLLAKQLCHLRLTSHSRHWDGWHWKRGSGRGNKWRKVQQSCLTVQVFTRSKALGQHHLVLTTVLSTACRRGGTGGEVMTHKLHYPTCYTRIYETYVCRGLITYLCFMVSGHLVANTGE